MRSVSDCTDKCGALANNSEMGREATGHTFFVQHSGFSHLTSTGAERTSRSETYGVISTACAQNNHSSAFNKLGVLVSSFLVTFLRSLSPSTHFCIPDTHDSVFAMYSSVSSSSVSPLERC